MQWLHHFVPSGKTITKVSLEAGRGERKDEDLFIGDDARAFLARKDEVHLRDRRIAEFYQTVRRVFLASCGYIKNKLPLDEELLQHAEVADPDRRVDAVSTSDLLYFLKRYPALVPEGKD
jgi:hypothetical protein